MVWNVFYGGREEEGEGVKVLKAKEAANGKEGNTDHDSEIFLGRSVGV